MKKISKLARNVLSVLPDGGREIKVSLRKLLVQKELAVIKLTQHITGATLPDPRTVYWIDPRRIEYHTALKNVSPDWEDWIFPQNSSLKLIQGGSWDSMVNRLEDMRIFRAIDARITNGQSWESTEYYQLAIDQIESGESPWGCTCRDDFDKHCTKVDLLIESITRNGYQSREVLGDMSGTDTSWGQSEILVNISRNGFPLFQDGRHRLAIAIALGIKKVPVQILVRHSNWQMFREYMHKMAKGPGGATKSECLYQRPVHFDLGDIRSEHGCQDRWNAISKNVGSSSAVALDIGCNLGYFCHQLEDLGYSCFGIEYTHDIAYAARKISQAEKRHLKILTGDVLSADALSTIGTLKFSVVIALNIFHHFIKTESEYNKLRELMKRIQVDTMFFEPHHPDEPQMQGAFFNPSPEEFANLIKDWGNFQSAIPIYSADDGRIIYKLSRLST